METKEVITGGVREYAVSEYLAICRGFSTPPLSISQALTDAVIDGDEGRLRAYLADPRRCEVLEDMVCLAAAHGNLRAVELLLPFCPSFTPVDGLIACTAAAGNGHLPIVRFFIEEMDADATYEKMLTRATRGGHLDVVRYLCARGADARMVDFEAVTEAAAGGHLEMIQYLVEHDVCMSKPRAPDALRSAARNGHIDIVVYLLERGLPAGIQAVNDAVAGGHLDILQCLHAHGANVLGDELIAVQSAAEFNNLEILSFLISVGADINADGDRALLIAVVKGHVETVRFLHAHGAGRIISLADALRMALRNGHTDLVVYLHERGADIRCNDDEAVRLAASGGHMSTLKYLHDHGANLHRGCDEAVVLAAPGGHLEMLSFLHTHGADLRTRNDAALRAAAEKRQWEAAGYLIRHGAAIANAKADDRGPLENYRAWMALHGRCPTALINLSRHYFRPEAFDDCLGFLEREGYRGETAHRMAYAAAGLFRTTGRLLAYLRKWGRSGKQPLHDLIQYIDLPQTGRFNVAAWGDAVLRCGPKMARLVTFASTLPEPCKDALGHWSYQATRRKLARFAFLRAGRHPQLARLCFEFDWSEPSFNAALAAIDDYAKRHGSKTATKPGPGLPDVVIEGAAFGKPGCTFRKLPDGDIRGLVLGEYSGSCQHMNGYGAMCARHGFVSEFGGFYIVIEDQTERIVGLSWAWLGLHGELVLDSLESRWWHVTAENWTALCQVFSRHIARSDGSVTAVLVGTGGATPVLPFRVAKRSAQPEDYQGYRDSDQQYVIWER